MALIRWEPFREIDSLQKEINRLFETFGTPTLAPTRNGGLFPAVELQETEEAIDLKVELPGMTPEDIDIQVSTEAVTISGERKSESTTEENGVTRSEFHYGKFQRVIPLPAPIQNAKVGAEYKDGILVLHLPKQEEARNKVVKVNLGKE